MPATLSGNAGAGIRKIDGILETSLLGVSAKKGRRCARCGFLSLLLFCLVMFRDGCLGQRTSAGYLINVMR